MIFGSFESLKSAWKLRMARCVRLCIANTTEFAEVLYYFKCRIGAEVKAFALVILFYPPDAHLLKDSEWTVWSAAHMGLDGLRVVEMLYYFKCRIGALTDTKRT
ncbi:hypothetical protein B0H11DRAFT_2373679 [Mycena galericulata]|nr:hypothetical protein B0H11DRAFT_1922109 [Mycena galericulata]KAJ7501417.1 hypothetical protein B0H11DRAFT_2373679 [Mycena galericulata]